MNWKNSEVIRNFMKIAEENNMFDDVAKNPFAEDAGVIEEKAPKAPEKDVIEEAHPKAVYVAESRGDGGLVENQNEQHEKLMEVVEKTPTGSLVGRYAAIAKELVKIADSCDQDGITEAADLITESIKVIVAKLNGPLA